MLLVSSFLSQNSFDGVCLDGWGVLHALVLQVTSMNFESLVCLFVNSLLRAGHYLLPVLSCLGEGGGELPTSTTAVPLVKVL